MPRPRLLPLAVEKEGMRAERRSAGKETMFRWRMKEGEEEVDEEEEKSAVVEEEFGRKCWKHPLHHPPYGVCAACLRDRLLRLCPECANVRPCPCFPSPYSSGSSYSSSSVGSREGADNEVGVGAVGLISRLIESEPAFCRSRSVGLELVRSRSVAAPAPGEEVSGPARPRGSGKGWGLPWPFSWVGSGRKESVEVGLYRSRTMVAGRSSVAGGCTEPGAKGKEGRRWHFPSPMKVFPSPMKVFRQRKPATKVVAQDRSRSPLWSG